MLEFSDHFGSNDGLFDNNVKIHANTDSNTCSQGHINLADNYKNNTNLLMSNIEQFLDNRVSGRDGGALVAAAEAIAEGDPIKALKIQQQAVIPATKDFINDTLRLIRGQKVNPRPGNFNNS